MPMPSASSTSAEPQREVKERLPCLATAAPAPAATNAAAVEMLNVVTLPPPVPHVSTRCTPSASTRTIASRNARAAPATSSAVSPLTRRPTSRAAICTGDASPRMTTANTAAARDSLSDCRLARATRACCRGGTEVVAASGMGRVRGAKGTPKNRLLSNKDNGLRRLMPPRVFPIFRVVTSRPFLAVVHYDGAQFVGWQRQAEGRTVQAEVEDVHAMRPGFHARKSATARRYRYVIGTDDACRSPFRRPYEWALGRPLDLDGLAQAAAQLPGEHDFRGLAMTGASPPDYRCHVALAGWAPRMDGAGVTFEIEADRFMHRMVRFLVGLMVDIALGRRPPSDLSTLLSASDNQAASPPAPPQGLYLAAVRYPPDLYAEA